jgi:hypothetical protein
METGNVRIPDRALVIRLTRLASMGDRAPLASDPSTREDSRRTTGPALIGRPVPRTQLVGQSSWREPMR